MNVPESAPILSAVSRLYCVSPGFTIDNEGNYLHVKHEMPITVRDTISERGSYMMDGRE